MNENDPTQNPPESTTPPVPPIAQNPPVVDAKPPAKKKRRLWLKIIVGLVVLFVLLVLLIPTIASTGMVRSIVVGKINDQLNGKLEIADWSLGWTSGVRVEGVTLTDADSKQILSLKSLDAPVSLIGLARGNYDLHKVVVDGLDFHAIRDEKGTLNFTTLAKAPPAKSAESSRPSPSETTPPEPAKQPVSSGTPTPAPPAETKLPDFRGEFVVTHCTGTIEDRKAKTTAKLTSLEADIKIPDINQPIEDTFDVAIENGKGATGKISAGGKLLLVKNNVLLTDTAQLIREADIDQKATLSGFDLATVAPFLGPDAGISELAGISDGEVTIRFKPQSDADVSAMLHLVKLAVGGKALKGDTFAAQSLEVVANHIAVILPPDAKDVDAARIRTGPTDGSGPISITLLQDGGSKSTITLFADVAQSSLTRLSKNLTPGASGTIHAAVDLDLAHLATSLPNLFGLQKGLTLKTGRLTDGTAIDLTTDKLALRQTLSVTGVAGRNAATQSDVALQPIELSVTASSLGGGGPVPDLRNLKLNLTSGFATASAQAESIDDLRGELHATLQQVQSELGQIIDFKSNQLAGNLDIALSSKGNLLGGSSSTGPAHTAALDIHGTLKNLRIIDSEKKAINEPMMQFAVTGQLHGSDQQSIKQLDGLDLTAMAGDAQHPTLDTHITAALAFEKAAGASAQDATTAVALQQATIQKLNVDLAQVQQQFGALIPALANVRISAGMATVTGFAKQNGDSTHSIIQAYLQNVDLQQLPDAKSGRAPVALLNGYVLHLLADGRLTADATGSRLNLAKLEVDDNQKLLAVQKTDAQVQLITGSGATAKNVGVLDMVQNAEASISVPSLPTLSAILNALSPAEETKVAAASAARAVPAKPKPVITAGSATVTLSVTHSDGQLKISPRVNLSSDLAIAAGAAKQTVGAIDFSTNIAIVPAAPPATTDKAPPTLLEQIHQLDIADLSAHAVGTEITLKQPLHITDVAGLTRLIPSTQPSAAPAGPAPSLSAALLVKGDIAPLAHLLETLDAAAPGTEYPYTGAFQLDEIVGTANGNMTVKGEGDVTQFVLLNGNAVSFSESDIHLANDVGLESGGKNLKIGGISLEMQSSKALSVAVKGALLDLAKQRTFQDVTADLTYDAAPLWKIVLPLLSKDSQEQFKDAVVSGKFTKHFTVTGSFPAEGELNDRIKNLSASGGLELAVFQGQGIDLQKLNVPIFMKNGKLYIANSDKPGDYAPPASMNGGTLSLSGVTIDMSDPHRTLSMNPNSQIMKNVGLNTALSHLLGKDTGNLLFADAGGSTGIMNVTVEKCDLVPTDDTMKQNVPTNKGMLAMDVSIQDLSLTGGTLGKVLDGIGPVIQVVAKGKGISTGSVKGSVKNYKITLAHGITTHDMTITLGEHQRTMHLASTVDLLKLQLKDTFLTIPVSLFGINDSQWPNGINLALTGTATSPKFDAVGAVQKSVLGGGGNPLDLINNAIGGKKKGAKKGGSGSANDNNATNDAIGAIEGLLGGNKKKPPATQPGN